MSNNQNNGWMNTADFCLQRRRRLELNKPPPRLNSTIANNYSIQAELDMRRKAEVLKYSAAASNSKTNNLTKAEKYAQLARLSKGNGSYNRIAKIQETCPFNELIKTPNYSCDVPGPYTLLYMDETVELYNYGKGNTTVATQNPASITELFKYILYENVESEYNAIDSSLQVASLLINSNDTIQEYSYKYPVMFEFTNEVSLSSTTPVSVTVANIFVYVYYNKTLISTNDNIIKFTPLPNISIPTIVFDNFNNTEFNSFDIQPSSTTFSGKIYLGTVSVENLQLCNQPHSIYDIRIMIVYTTNPGNIIQYKTLANFSYRDISYSNSDIQFNNTEFNSAEVSGISTVQNVYTSLIEPKDETLNIITEGINKTVTFGSNSSQVNFDGEFWWNNNIHFPNSGFINQLV